MSPERPVRVVIADDQTIVREGLRTLLEMTADIEVVADVADGLEAIAAVDEHRPDALLLDLHMPILDGVQTTRRLARDHPEVAIVVLTTYADDATILAALRAGARGYLTKNANRREISQALRGAVGGQTILAPDVAARLLSAAGETAPDAAPAPRELPDGLTPREVEVMALIVRGLSNPEIAAELVISEHTVKTHINHLFAKTGSRDRAQAIAYAHAHELL